MKLVSYIALLSLFSMAPAMAESLVAVRTIRAQTVLTSADVAMVSDTFKGALSAPDVAIGLETRVAIYEGRPIRAADIGPPAIVERNQIIQIVFQNGSLAISTEGRSLGRAGSGERLRVMNLSSRSTVMGTVSADGTVIVGQK